MPPPVAQSIFYSYSSADEAFRAQLEDHLAVLRRAGVIETWGFRDIEAGDDWKRRIDERLEVSTIILLLVSSNFLGSNYCWDIEMKRALERHAAGQAVVIPVILKDCDWQAAPFAGLQALPEGGKAITRRRPRDRAWAEVVAGIRRVVQSRAPVNPLPTEPTSSNEPRNWVPDTAPPSKPLHAISWHQVTKAPGPWFHLIGAAATASSLDFMVKNEGAPVIVLEFAAITPGCRVSTWNPGTLPSKETFRAPTLLANPDITHCTYEMKVRDESGMERLYRLTLDRQVSPGRLDFKEIG